MFYFVKLALTTQLGTKQLKISHISHKNSPQLYPVTPSVNIKRSFLFSKPVFYSWRWLTLATNERKKIPIRNILRLFASGKPERMVQKCLADLGLGGDKVRPRDPIQSLLAAINQVNDRYVTAWFISSLCFVNFSSIFWHDFSQYVLVSF